MKDYRFLEPYQFQNGVNLKNRVVMAPMTTMSSFYNGMITKDELDYYAARAGGPGLIITAVANVSANGKGFQGELSAAGDEMIPGLKKLASAIKKDGTKAVLQIFHAGRKTYSRILGGVKPVSASAVRAVHPKDSEVPRELTGEEIEEIILDFGKAARRAILAGFDGVELHGANTYLLQQFYSENSNQRTDRWGGGREQRMAFAKAVIAETARIIEKNAARPFLMGYRISPEEVETPGIRVDDSLYFADSIKNSVDYIHLSMGSYKRTSLNDPSDKRLLLNRFAKIIKNQVPLIGVGSVETPADAEEVLKQGAALVAIGRELIREPHWVQKAEGGDEEGIRTAISLMDMDELAIPPALQVSLKESFYKEMHFTADHTQGESYHNRLAPMEGGEKKL